MSEEKRTEESWHVVLFHVYADGTATEAAWWVGAEYAADMRAHMGQPDGERLYSAADVRESIRDGSKVPMLTPLPEGTQP